jgi:hypothetical protein
MTHVPYLVDLTPEERGRRLVAALRALPEDNSPVTLPGNGDFAWDYSLELGDPGDTNHFLPEGWCGTVGCAVGLGICLGLLADSDDCYSLNKKAEHLEEQLGIAGAHSIFYYARTYFVDWSEVTPAMVADELEKALAR